MFYATQEVLKSNERCLNKLIVNEGNNRLFDLRYETINLSKEEQKRVLNYDVFTKEVGLLLILDINIEILSIEENFDFANLYYKKNLLDDFNKDFPWQHSVLVSDIATKSIDTKSI